MLPFSTIVATEHILCCVNGTVSHSVTDTQIVQLSNLNGALREVGSVNEEEEGSTERWGL